jgi:glycosyltransferase involved in cell wall biosynthesis
VTPLVSIVICTRNRASKLGPALDSMSRITSYFPWELIIVDNASTDHTADIIKRAAETDGRIRYLCVDRIGLGAGRDAAWRIARGAFVCFTDDDCYVMPDYVNQIVAVFEEFPEVGCVGGRIMLHDQSDARVTIDERSEAVGIAPRQFIAAGTLHGANLSFRRDALAAAGGFDPEFGAGTQFPAEDIDAVAAVIWSGRPARYDPRPTVAHHHGRKEEAVPGLMKGYDAGRGAYLAKYMLRRDTRTAYAKAWLSGTLRSREPGHALAAAREIMAGARYAIRKGRKGALIVAAPILASALAIVWCRVNLVRTVRTARRIIGGNAGRSGLQQSPRIVEAPVPSDSAHLPA